MKKLTTQEVMEALATYMSTEYEEADERVYYYLHLKDSGEIVQEQSKADESFRYPVSREAVVTEDWEEDENNPFFVEVAEELTEMANAYFEEWGE